ncbi:MAG: hypothetical protein JWP97_1255 [Labilithrix sp.]|nr:hypothetical protein [Labilithrix sp.]
MSFWKGLADKVSQKKEELEAEAKRRASKKASEMAIEGGKAAARSAVKNAGRTLDFAGKKLGEALFGPEAAPDAPPVAGDPFAKLKAEEAAREGAARKDKADARERKAAEARTEREVDEELAALKRKIQGK